MGETPLGELVVAYTEHQQRRGVVKVRDARRSLEVNLRPFLKLPAGELSRTQVVDVMRGLERAGKPEAAADLRKHAVAMLNWAVNEGRLATNVMAGYRQPRATRLAKVANDRITFVGEEQIAAFWKASDAARSTAFRDLLRFLLITGQRRTETTLMQWSDVDLERGAWAIPAAVTKTGAGHRVPLGPLSSEILRAQPRHAGSGLVFPGRGLRPISGWTKQLAPVRARLQLQKFAPHALRRTFRTGLAELGVPEPVAEVMIAHKRSDLAHRYDKSELWERRWKLRSDGKASSRRSSHEPPPGPMPPRRHARRSRGDGRIPERIADQKAAGRRRSR